MKKRRYLRTSIEKALFIITMLLFMFLACINDFELSAFPFILLGWAIVGLNIYILKKYGKGVYLEEKEEEMLK